MFRALFVSLSLAGAARIQIETQQDTQLGVAFGASCDNLQNRFRNQVHTLKMAVDAHSESAFAQARAAMRMHGLVRTLRRAQECDWVVENDSEDIEEMRGIMQDLLAGNSCADAARSELDAGASSEDNEALARAMLILMSDDCVAPEIQSEDNTQTPEADLQQAEVDLQDSIDQIMDAEEEGESFIQLEHGDFQRFMRGVGVFLLTLFFLLACVAAVAAIVAVLAAAVLFIYMTVNFIIGGATVGAALSAAAGGWYTGGGAIVMMVGGFYAAIGSLPVGVVGCAYRTYTTTLPRISGSQ